MWEIKDVFISDGVYSIQVNKNQFPKNLNASDTLYMPTWIPEQELLDVDGLTLTFLFIVNEKKIK